MKIARWTIASALALCLSMLLPAVRPAYAEEKHDIPLVMLVVGFDGGEDPAAAVPYDDEYDWNAALFGPGESPASYFRDLSNGAFTFSPATETSATDVAGNTNTADQVNDGVVHVTVHRPHGSWGGVNIDSAIADDFAATIREVLGEANAFINFASYDADGDGELTAQELSICLCVAGYEAASVTDFERADIPLIWSHSGLLSIICNGNRSVNGISFDAYTAIAERNWNENEPLETAEQESLGVVYHELGHALGLPDLYAVKYTEGPWSDYKVGAQSLMDEGGWQYADDGDGLRNIPTALDAWSRYVLGWTKPVVVVHSGNYLVSSQLSSTGYTQLIIPTSNPDEYYLVENRQPEGHDISLAEDYSGENGLLIWHVDNKMFEKYYSANQMNDANHRPGVMYERLDGETELLLYNSADDTPDACMGSGIVVWPESDPGRDMIVHVELDDEAPVSLVSLFHDKARDQLTMEKDGLLENVIWLTRSALQGLK